MIKLILLPGMDGTGKLFEGFIEQFDATFEIESLHYSTDQFLSYPELERFVAAAIPESEPYVLVAESYSTPLAVMCAANQQPNLKGVVMCAGFVTSPVRNWRRFVCSLLATLVIGSKLPDIASKWFLAGSEASPSLLAAILSAISSVKPRVLAQRIRAILACDVRAELLNVEVPILYLQGDQDRMVGPSCLEEIRGIQPQISVEKITGPHLLLQREPERAAAAVKGFIERIPIN